MHRDISRKDDAAEIFAVCKCAAPDGNQFPWQTDFGHFIIGKRLHTDAEDAVTDTFVRIIDNLEKFTEVDKDKLPGLIAVCTKNVALNAYQKKSRQNARETSSTVYDDEDEAVTVDFADPDAGVEQAVLDGEFIQKVAELIRRLPEEQQTVVVLKYFYHYRNGEIADLLKLSRNAADSRLFRAKNSLRKMLSEL